MAQGVTAPPRTLGAAIDDHRIWFEVERETAQQGEQRITSLARVWLWGTIPRGAGALPGEPGCRGTVEALEAAASAAIARAGLDPAPDVEPFHWSLYASRQVADADELRLGIVVRVPPGTPAAEDAARERAIARLRTALEQVGIAEGAWRPGAPAPDGDRAEARSAAARHSASPERVRASG
jgi:hypothetical protein